LPTQKQYGIMAQDLQAIFPEMVLESVHNIPNPNNEEATNDFTIKAVNYSQLIPVLVRAIKEQQKMIEELKREIDALKNK
jgi:DNA-directed RNA polymerase subunit L